MRIALYPAQEGVAPYKLIEDGEDMISDAFAALAQKLLDALQGENHAANP